MYEKSCASSNHIKSWKDIDFGTAEYEVKKLQMRNAKAVKENRVGKIKSLQWTLTHSFYAKAIAVKRVTENKGKKTHTYRLRGITEPFTPQTFEDKWFVVMETKKNRCLFNTLSYPISRSSVQ